MKFKQFTQWIRGQFTSKGDQSRIPDNSAIQLHNLDLSPSGRIRRRAGYGVFEDMPVLGDMVAYDSETQIYLSSPSGLPSSNPPIYGSSWGGGSYTDYCNLSIGSFQWRYYNGSWNVREGSGDFGSISFATNESGDQWGTFPDGDELKTFSFSGNGGYFEYYYNKDAWETAFDSTEHDVIIAQNGSVYKNSISTSNLVVRWDGVVGSAGGGSSIEDAERIYEGNYVLSSDLRIPIQGIGFGDRIQSIHSFIDVGGKRYIFIISNGNCFIMEYRSGKKKWILINPNRDVYFRELKKHIRSVSYYDSVFMNDVGTNVYMFDAQGFSTGTLQNKHIFFSGQRIFFRKEADFSPDTHSHAITAVNTGTKTFTVSGDYHFHYYAGDTISVTGSTGGNDGDYTVVSSTYSAPSTNVVVSEAISSGVADGNLVSNFRIMIENDSNNYSGKDVYDSLVDIDFIGAGKPIDTGSGEDESDLALGYCIEVNDYFYVLESAQNERSNDKCYIIKFNRRFIAQDFLSFDCDSSCYILNFDYFNGKFYLFSKDAEINIFNEGMINTNVDYGNLSFATKMSRSLAPNVNQYTICVNSNGIFIPSKGPTGINDRVLNYNSIFKDLVEEWGNSFVGVYPFSIEKYFGQIGLLDVAATFSAMPNDGPIYGISRAPATSFLYSFTPGSKTFYSLNKTPYSLYYEYISPPGTSLWMGNYDGITKWTTAPAETFYDFSSEISDSKCKSIVIHSLAGTAYVFAAFEGFTYAAHNRLFRMDPSGPTIVELTLPSPASSTLLSISDLRKNVISGNYIYAVFNNAVLANSYRVYRWLYSETDIASNGEYYEVDENISNGYYISGSYIYYASGKNIKRVDTSGNETIIYTDDYDIIAIEVAFLSQSNISFINSNREYGEVTTSGTISLKWSNMFSQYSNTETLKLSYSGTGGLCAFDSINIYPIKLFGNDATTPVYICKYDLDTFLISGKFYFFSGYRDESYGVSPLEKNGNTIYGSAYFDSLDIKPTFEINTDIGEFVTKKMITDRSVALTGQSDYRTAVRGSDENYSIIRMSESSSLYYYFSTNFSVNELISINNVGEIKDYNANLFLAKSIGVFDLDIASPDYLRELGAPKRVSVELEDDATSTMTNGTKFKYYMSFKFYDDDYTPLSAASDVIDIPNVAGAGAQPLKVVITGCNLKNDRGEFIYETDDIEEIYIYRSKKTTGDWSVPTYLNKLEKDSSDEWYVGGAAHTYALETVEDNAQTLAVNPFAPSSVRKYPCRDIVVHKNRLILVNRTDEVNSNVLNFSGVDVAQAIPPENIRDIQSGDGDQLYGAVSIGDYLYLFKEHHTYAILGDVETGQLVDVDLTIGTKYTFSIVRYRNSIFFMNEDGIFQLTGTQIQDISYFRYDDFFNQIQLWGDPDNEVLDFENMADNVYGFVDTKAREIMWCVPQKVGGNDQSTNNIIIIYNINLGTLRSYSYNDPAFIIESVKDVSTGVTKTIFTDYSGQLYEIGAYNDDNGSDITYSFTTKAFNLGSDIVHKSFRLLKFFGKNLDDVTVSYEIDGTETSDAEKVVRSFGDKDEVMVTVTSNGIDNSIKVTVSGTANEDDPVEINEILLGYQPLRGIGN